MTCNHLHALEDELIAAGIKETFRGAAWSMNCREWVYFNAVLDIPSLANRFKFTECIKAHENLDAKSGQESGFVCSKCNDAIMGATSGQKVYR